MDNITQFFSTVSSWAVAITAILTALSLLFKPFGRLVAKILGIRKNTEETKKEFTEIKKDIGEIKNTLSEVKESNSILKEDVAVLSDKVESVARENDDNERSRIRRDIMKYGSLARLHQPISEREFESIRLDYEKYHGPLHGNGIVSEEYAFVRDYYNKHAHEWM